MPEDQMADCGDPPYWTCKKLEYTTRFPSTCSSSRRACGGAGDQSCPGQGKGQSCRWAKRHLQGEVVLVVERRKRHARRELPAGGQGIGGRVGARQQDEGGD